MKRFFLLFLAALLLAGCSAKPVPTEPTESTAVEIPPPEMYIANSDIEQLTFGAVRAYRLGTDAYSGLYTMGTNLLIVGKRGLFVLSGDTGKLIAATEVASDMQISQVDVSAIGVAFYRADTRQVVVLNPQLQFVTQFQLPEDIAGKPVISLNRNEIYYSIGKEIRAMHMDTGISRLLRQQAVETQVLLDAYFDGAVLACQCVNGVAQEEIEYISSETGQAVGSAHGVFDMQTCGENYIAQRLDGIVYQMIFGVRGGEARCFLADQSWNIGNGGRVAVPELNGVIDYTQSDNGLALSFYDLGTGKRIAEITLPAVQLPTVVHSDGTHIWLLAANKNDGNQFLYRWEIDKSSVEDETIYIGAFYTNESPDVQGLAQCRTLADSYEKQYGVKIAIWQDAIKHTGMYTATAEYHPQVITAILEKLQSVLAQFPEKFLLKTVEAGWIRIALVRSIDNDSGWAQFWEGGDCWIILSTQQNAVHALLQGMAYGVDSHVLGNSRDFDTWDQLNPEGFQYAYSYTVNEKSEYLVGDQKAFTDALALSYPHEDRCRIFYHAMLPDNAAMFTSEPMQAKLLRLCMGIREAYNLEKSPQTYAWEQYLEISLAY